MCVHVYIFMKDNAHLPNKEKKVRKKIPDTGEV